MPNSINFSQLLSYFCDPSLHNSSFNIPSEQNNMYNKLYDHFLIIKAIINDNRQDCDEKMKTHESKLDKNMAIFKNMMV